MRGCRCHRLQERREDAHVVGVELEVAEPLAQRVRQRRTQQQEVPVTLRGDRTECGPRRHRIVVEWRRKQRRFRLEVTRADGVRRCARLAVCVDRALAIALGLGDRTAGDGGADRGHRTGGRPCERLGRAQRVVRRVGVAAQCAQLRRGRVKLRDHMIVSLLTAELDARSVDLLHRATLARESVDRHEGRAHRRLREPKIVRAGDLERLAERVEGLRRVTAARAHVDESAFGPTEGRNVGVLLLERQRTQIRPLRGIELAEKVMQLREGESLGELAGAIGEEPEGRLGLEMRARGLLDLAQVGVRSADDMPQPCALRRRPFPDETECLVRLQQSFARTTEIAKRLRRPGECACEALGVARAPKLCRRVAVVRKRTLVVPAHAMKKSAKQDDPGQTPLRAGREPVEPALERGDLASLQRALAVLANELRGTPVITGLREMMDRALDAAACRRAFGVSAMQLDDLCCGQELMCARAKELRVQRLKAMAAIRTVAHHKACLLERGEQLARRAARRDLHVVLDTVEQGPSQDRVLVAARSASQDLAVEVRVELRSAALELAELLPASLAHERRGEPQPGGPAARPRVHRVDRVLGQLESELATEQLDRLRPRERELRRGDVEHRPAESPPWEATELGRAAGGEDEVRVLGEELEELVAECGEWRAGANAGMIIEKEDELAERCELVGERLRELTEAPLQPTALVEERRELLAECRGIAPQRSDEIREQDEWILVAALQGQPGCSSARRAKQVGGLREHGGLAVPRGGMDERQPVAPRSLEAVEQPLPSKQRERQ